MLRLGLQSLWNRRFVVLLTILSIAVSVMLVLGVERLRSQAKASFANAASGIDLIVAARDNPVQILLSTVFGVGGTSAGLDWESFEMVHSLPQVDWAVPISIGDNHRGFPVIGTEAGYFEHYRHSGGQELELETGTLFSGPNSAVIGAEPAARFGYFPGAEIILAHGSGEVALDVHDEAPFVVAGVLAPAGTAVDRMVFVPLEGFDAMHDQREPDPADPFADPSGSDVMGVSTLEAGDTHVAPDDHDHEHEAETVNAIYVGLKDRGAVLSVQRAVADYRQEPLTAVLPNVALLELWSITGTAETALRLMAVAVVLAGLVGMVVMLSATLEGRRREFAILRSVGATPARIFALILLEAGMVTLAGVQLGCLLLAACLAVADPILATQYGLRLADQPPTSAEIWLLVAIVCGGIAASLPPAIRVYRMTLSDGLTIRM